MTKPLTSQLKQMLQPQRLLPALTTGFIVALLDVFVEISLAVMIFSGDLSAYVSRGIGFALFGAMMLSFVSMTLTSFPGSVVLPQDSPAAILALMATSIIERQDVIAGQYLIRQGEKPRGLYFIESGRVTVQLESPDGRAARVRTMNAG
ncbi:MAG: cyclic nucleotide-binding domain-containing protein, partial [Anaerolineae bacterium]